MTYKLPTTGLELWAFQTEKIVISLIKEGLDEYKQVLLFRLPSIPTLKFEPEPDISVANPEGYAPIFTLREISNHYYLEPTRTEEEFQEELLSKSAKIANEISIVVNFLVREQTKKYGFDYKRQLDKISAIDIFTKQDGTPNLKINVVKNVASWDPDVSMIAWIAYKFLFACGQ